MNRSVTLSLRVCVTAYRSVKSKDEAFWRLARGIYTKYITFSSDVYFLILYTKYGEYWKNPDHLTNSRESNTRRFCSNISRSFFYQREFIWSKHFLKCWPPSGGYRVEYQRIRVTWNLSLPQSLGSEKYSQIKSESNRLLEHAQRPKWSLTCLVYYKICFLNEDDLELVRRKRALDRPNMLHWSCFYWATMHKMDFGR